MGGVKAIIFDYYGVLLSSTHDQRLAKLYEESPERGEEYSALNSAADKGIISHEASRRRMAELMNISYEQLLQDYADGEIPNEALMAYIEKELKPRYKIGLLSNSTSRAQLDVRFAPGRLDGIFDAIVSSGEIGFVKPQTEAYEYVAMKLGALPGECIMVDDVAAYCEGAVATGMQAIQFKRTDQAIRDLSAILDGTPKKVYS